MQIFVVIPDLQGGPELNDVFMECKVSVIHPWWNGPYECLIAWRFREVHTCVCVHSFLQYASSNNTKLFSIFEHTKSNKRYEKMFILFIRVVFSKKSLLKVIWIKEWKWICTHSCQIHMLFLNCFFPDLAHCALWHHWFKFSWNLFPGVHLTIRRH